MFPENDAPGDQVREIVAYLHGICKSVVARTRIRAGASERGSSTGCKAQMGEKLHQAPSGGLGPWGLSWSWAPSLVRFVGSVDGGPQCRGWRGGRSTEPFLKLSGRLYVVFKREKWLSMRL